MCDRAGSTASRQTRAPPTGRYMTSEQLGMVLELAIELKELTQSRTAFVNAVAIIRELSGDDNSQLNTIPIDVMY